MLTTPTSRETFLVCCESFPEWCLHECNWCTRRDAFLVQALQIALHKTPDPDHDRDDFFACVRQDADRAFTELYCARQQALDYYLGKEMAFKAGRAQASKRYGKGEQARVIMRNRHHGSNSPKVKFDG